MYVNIINIFSLSCHFNALKADFPNKLKYNMKNNKKIYNK